jgi:UDP-N-acetylglucosamine 2-epimerase
VTDDIFSFLEKPVPISHFVPEITDEPYALMTFHSVTNAHEPIAEILRASVSQILSHGFKVMLTYPNNDEGTQEILQAIESVENLDGVVIRKSSGAQGYYAALNDCEFVIGNSSSGVREAPYFNKPVVNVGTRQDGREMDEGVESVEPTVEAVTAALADGFERAWPKYPCAEIYGSGNTSPAIRDVLYTLLER